MKAIMLVFLFASCSQLTTKGRLVQVWKEMTPEKSVDYREVGEVNCGSQIYMVTRNFNRKRCTEGLRNATSRLGGVVVVIEKEKSLPGFMSTGIEMTGTAYRNIR